MKRNYEFVEVKIIHLNAEDIITASASRNDSLLGQNFDLGDLGIQNF